MANSAFISLNYYVYNVINSNNNTVILINVFIMLMLSISAAATLIISFISIAYYYTFLIFVINFFCLFNMSLLVISLL